MSCKSCGYYKDPDSIYKMGACLFFQAKAGNLSVDPTDLSVHGVAGCSHWIKPGTNVYSPARPLKRDYNEPKHMESDFDDLEDETGVPF